MVKHRMTKHTAPRNRGLLALLVLLAVIVSACNLSGAPSEEQIAQTDTALATVPPTRTPQSTNGIPTTFPVTQFPNQPTFVFPTSIVVVPTGIPPQVFPSSTPLPVSIVILSPVSGNVVAGNVQILGSAIHPQFLQYQVEFGPDPNPGNLWFPATSAVTSPVLNGLLGIWNTTTVQDSRYQLRLRVYLRDGTLLTTVIGNIAVQNRINTPVPSATPNIPRPIAAFTQDKASGNVPLTVQFSNQSTGTINSMVWNFGDGNSSSQVNPNHTFGSPGLYTVTLSVNGPGGSSNVTRQINVTSPTAPVAGFTQDRTAGVAPLTVQFTDQSSGSVSSYLWNFSDGSTTTERNPVHTFTTPGTYNVFLTVTGAGGSSSVTRQITVNSVIPPTATPTATFTPTFTPSPTSTETATVIPVDTSTPTATFTDTATPTEIPPTATFTPTEIPAPKSFFSASGVLNDPLSVQFTDQSTGNITAYLWDFGDGMTSSEQSPLHTYQSDGTYTVTLTVGSADGRTDSHSEDVTVATPISAGFNAQISGLGVQFTNQSTGSIASLAWDFGDGATSNDVNPLHTYPGGGTYTVTLTVSSADGRSDSRSEDITVAAPLVASFNAQISGLDAQFVNQSSGDVASIAWDFGDGATSNEVNPLHTYPAGGTYTVTLTIGSAHGRTESTNQQVTLAAPLVAGFTASPNGLDVQFANQSTGDVASVAWDFGDGATSNEVNPLHTYPGSGTYTVTLTIGSADGRTNSTNQQVTVAAPLVANFTAQPNGLDVQFTNQSSGDVASVAWDFGDGATSNDVNPLHTYPAGGTYTVTLTIGAADGSSTSTNQPVTVSAPLVANFTAQPNGLDVQFTNQASGDVASVAWDFGDGATSNDVNPLHTYPAGGTYTVTLTIGSADGRSDSHSEDVNVAAPLVAGFTASPNGLDVQFANQSTGDVTSVAWDFGDGATSNDVNPLHTYPAGGTYTVTLTIGSADGRSDSHSEDVNVAAPLVANFIAQPNGLDVQFTNQSSGDVASVAWDFGDGAASNEVNPLHTYPAGGTYTVTLAIGSADGRSDSHSEDVNVAAPLVANFTAQPNGLDVQFTNQSSGDVASVAWDFGDGATSNEVNPLHTYPAGGTYTVTLAIGSADGRSTSTNQPVTVSAPLVASFSAQPNGLDIQFANQSSGDVASVAWDFGDGATSNDVNPLHTYPAGGTYTVTLTIGAADGRTESTNQQVTVAAPLVANFTAQPNGLDVQFTNQSSGDVASVAWDFGDGATSNEVNPLHTYPAGGTYTVTLTVGSADGRSDSHSEDVNVAAPLVANFTAQPNDLDVQFTNQSSGDVASVAWDFGDGATSNDVNPLHTYPAGGTYTVTLTIGAADGSTTSTNQQVTVAAPLVANFTAQPNGLDVQFTNQSSGDVASVAWDFGDGATSNEVNPLHTYPGGGTYTVTLTIGAADGSSTSTNQPVTVSVPLHADFTAQVNGLDVQFANQSSGDVASVTWDFGDGATSNDVNPLHTYPAGGTYTVALTVGSADGRTDSRALEVTVAAPLTAKFDSQVNGLDVQFIDQSSGGVTSYMWDFGDGATSNEQSPLHTYPAGGTYTVILTVGDANGRSANTSADVNLAAPPPTQPQQTLVDTTPIMPDINALAGNLSNIFQTGLSTSKQATVFAKAGDSIFTQPNILSPFATAGQYALNGNEDLQSVIDWFNQTDLGGTTSFNRLGVAVNQNWTAQDLLGPNNADPSVCSGGELPLDCELRLTQPAVMLVAVGQNDANNGTNVNAFTNTLAQIVSTISSNGTIPVLLTVPDDGSNPALSAINDAIVTVANQNSVPLLNAARALNELPNSALNAAPSGGGDLGADAVSNFGVNALNLDFLRVFDSMRNIIGINP